MNPLDLSMGSSQYHASLNYLANEYMTNKSLRKRFNLRDNQSSLVSKAIALSITKGLIKVFDEKAGNKFRLYIPFWGDTDKKV
jgi:predicted HTH transcriptional regulator